MPWGGDLNPATAGSDSGIAWLVLDSPEFSSEVINGALAGETLGRLMQKSGADLVGRRYVPGPFPLCLRILDVGKAMPLLVHPDEAFCREHPGHHPNTKFWYCLAARDGASIMVGIKHRVTGMQLMRNLDTQSVAEQPQTFPAMPGDSYLIPAGRVHSVTGGTLLLEVGQRPLEPMAVHLAGSGQTDELAWRAIHFEDRQVSRICREVGNAVGTRRIPLVHHCPYFVADEIRLAGQLFDRTDGASFHLFHVIRGQVTLDMEGGAETLAAGATCLVPALAGNYRLAAGEEGTAVLLRFRLQSLK